MKEVASLKLKEALKRQLKLKKIGYQELAEHLNCSVPTVKRILTQEELTLSRLLAILEFLNLSLGELEMLAGQGDSGEVLFTPEQEKFLAENPHFLTYMLQLYGGDTPKKIAEKYKLDARATDKYLMGLEKHGLIKVTGKLRVKPRYKQVPHLGDGPLAKKYLESIISTSAALFMKMINDDIFSLEQSRRPKEQRVPKTFAFQGVKAKPETYKRYFTEQKKAMDEFQKAATYEEKTMDESELKTAVVLFAGSLVENDYPALDSINNVFGMIKPI